MGADFFRERPIPDGLRQRRRALPGLVSQTGLIRARRDLSPGVPSIQAVEDELASSKGMRIEHMDETRVEQIMTPGPICVDEGGTVAELGVFGAKRRILDTSSQSLSRAFPAMILSATIRPAPARMLLFSSDMKPPRYVVPLFLAALLVAFASWRRSDAAPARSEDAAAVSLSTAPGKGVTRAVLPQTPEERYRTALFYSDLGPDTVDVSAYPAQQRYNYAVYARSCSRCHTLARSINAPMVGRGWWEFYMLGMRLRGRQEGQPFSKDQVKAVLDFLEYDSRVRKVEHAHAFGQLTEELKARFDASIAERMRALQKANPRPLAPSEP